MCLSTTDHVTKKLRTLPMDIITQTRFNSQRNIACFLLFLAALLTGRKLELNRKKTKVIVSKLFILQKKLNETKNVISINIHR